MDVIIPNGVRIIGNNAFSGCSSLEKIVIPAGVEIEDNAFCGCKSITAEGIEVVDMDDISRDAETVHESL